MWFFFVFFFWGGGVTFLLLYYQIQISVLFNLLFIFIWFQNASSQPFKKIGIKVLKNQSRWNLMWLGVAQFYSTWLSVAQFYSTWLSVAQVVPLSACCVSCCSKRSHRMGICSPMYGC